MEEGPRKDTSPIVNLLGPISRLSYDQFAKVTIRASVDRRELVLDNIHWPSTDIQCHFMDLPLPSPDLLGGKFDAQLSTKIKGKKDINKAEFTFSKDSWPSKSRKPSRSSSQCQPKSSSFPTCRNLSSSHQQCDRSCNQPSFRGFSGPLSTSCTSHCPSRGSSHSGSCSFSSFQPKP